MPRLSVPVIVLASLLLLPAGFPAASMADDAAVPASPSPPLAVRVDHGLVSVDVRDALLGDLLRAVGEQADVKVTIRSGGADRVTDSFAGVGVDDAIRRLAQGHDVVLIYGSPRNRRLVEVRVYETSPPPAAPAVIDPRQRGVRLQVVRSLIQQARQGQAGALASLVNVLSSDPDAVVRQVAAGALAGFADPQAVSALRAAAGDQDPAVRSRVVTSLGQMHEEGSAEIVAQALARDPDTSVRRAAAWALSAFQSDGAHRALEAAAASDTDASIRRAAAGALRLWERRARAK